MELPQLFVEKMKSLLGEEYSDYEACLKRPKQNGIRVIKDIGGRISKDCTL